jgi:branched-chain amino acid transport system ATP-binding protein
MLLEINNLKVFYENALALNNVTINCRETEITGVFGPNSAGKSTLMFTISGIILDMQKTEIAKGGERITIIGQIIFKGKDITLLKPSERTRIGIVLCPERRHIFPESSALENLKIGAYLTPNKIAKKTMDYVFTLFPALKNLKNIDGGLLSGGEQQMLAIGRALMAQPKLLLLDEPLLGLSPMIQSRLIQAIKKINEETKITILITEQYAQPIFPIIDYGYVIENGNVVLSGNSKELMSNPHIKSAYLGW